jgi:hypothetical protein
MGLLDELKQQAETQKQRQQTTQESRDRLRESVHIALRDAARYFIELADSLNVLRPEVFRHFYVSETRLDRLSQSDYNARDRRKAVSSQDYFQEAGLRLRCLGEQPVVIDRDSPDAIKNLREYLWAYNFRFDCKETLNDRGLVERARFTVLPEVPSAIVLTGDWETGEIRLTLKNIEMAGEVNYLYDAAEVSRELLDEITKLLLAKPNQLRKLGRHQEMTSTSPRVVAGAAQPSLKR